MIPNCGRKDLKAQRTGMLECVCYKWPAYLLAGQAPGMTHGIPSTKLIMECVSEEAISSVLVL